MKPLELHDKVIEEIRLIPPNRLSEIYNLIHFFRIGLEADRKKAKKTMRFAGCWQDMAENEFQELAEEIQERRRRAFSRSTF